MGSVALSPQAVPVALPRRTGRLRELQDQIERLLERMRIAVIYGGDKSVDGTVINQTINTRSWKSYQAVAEDIADALQRIGARQVHLIAEDMHLARKLSELAIDLAWLNTGGVQGFNPMSHASALLEMVGIPYVGHDPLTASTLDNKHSFKRDLIALGLPTPTFMSYHPLRSQVDACETRRFRSIFQGYGGPFIVKPVSGRASQHVHVVEEVSALQGVIDEIYETTHNHVLIEEYLEGREFCIAICGHVVAKGGQLQRSTRPFVFGAVERVLEPDEKIFTSMDVRPITVDRIRAIDPARDPEVAQQLEELATDVFSELGLETLVRLDVRSDKSGRMYVLEANPKPDLKAPKGDKTSLVCASLAHYGMSYDDLILSLLADRIDLLFSQRRGSVAHLASLLKQG